MASDNNVYIGVSAVFTFKYSRSNKIHSMVGMSVYVWVQSEPINLNRIFHYSDIQGVPQKMSFSDFLALTDVF